MPKQKISKQKINAKIMKDKEIVKHSVNQYRKYVYSIFHQLDDIEPVIIKELCYFSIMESIAQDIQNYPTKRLQDVFTEFILKYQNRYDFLELLEPVTLFYRKEEELSKYINLDCITDGGIYFPEDNVIRHMANEIESVVNEKLNYKGEKANKLLKNHRYVDLLYRLRCRLSHEFCESGTTESQFHDIPYYMNSYRMYVKDERIVSDNVWTMQVPVIFLKNLCINCIDNYLDDCVENVLLPIKNNNLDRICELSWYNRN